RLAEIEVEIYLLGFDADAVGIQNATIAAYAVLTGFVATELGVKFEMGYQLEIVAGLGNVHNAGALFEVIVSLVVLFEIGVGDDGIDAAVLNVGYKELQVVNTMELVLERHRRKGGYGTECAGGSKDYQFLVKLHVF